MARVLGLIPPGGTALDAPCGTGKYFPMLAAVGHQVAGVDQSAGMLARARARARARDIAFSLQRTSLQDLAYASQFDAVLTIDAMRRASGGVTAGAITTSCCAPARLRQHHDMVRYRGTRVSCLHREGHRTNRIACSR